MRRVAQQIGWSQESKLIYNIINQLDRLAIVWDGCCTTTTTSTTTSAPCQSYYIITPLIPSTAFDIPSLADYTIEWFMNMTDDNNFPRIFSIGAYPSAQHAVSIEGDTLYYWVNGSIQDTVSLTSYLGQWVWVVISRRYLDISIYINGIRASLTSSTAAIPANGNPLSIGCEYSSGIVSGTNYNGLLSNFRWTTASVYEEGSDITSQAPTAPLTVLPQTVILAFQGNSLPQEVLYLTGPSIDSTSSENNGCFLYNSNNPFEGYEGSITFRSI